MNLYGSKLFYLFLVLFLFVLQFVLLVACRPEIQRRRFFIKRRTLDLVFYICIALSVASLFRLYPGNAAAPIQDSSAFLYIGRRMTEGKLPYRDLFDHKGPVLYLIQWLGIWAIPDSFTGVWLLEVLNLFATGMCLRKLAALVSDNDVNAYLSVMAAVGVCGWMVWQGGNFTEEFALPWISAAAYICFRFICYREYRAVDILILGAGFGVVLLLRANMIAAWAVLMPPVLLTLLKGRRYREIGKCTLLFISGILIVMLPVLLWARLAGFISEMWQDYILFNLSYTDSTSTGFTDRLILAGQFMLVLWPASAAVLVSLFVAHKNGFAWLNFLFYLFSSFTAAMSGRLYYHYAIMMLPAAVLPFCICFNCFGKLLSREKTQTDAEPVFLVALFCLMLIGAVSYRHIFSNPSEDDPVTTYLKENTSVEDDVLILGNSSWYYLLADRKTENRFFYQLPPMEISIELRDAFLQELQQYPSDCILIPGGWEERDWINEMLGDVRMQLEELSGNQFQKEVFDEFEVYIQN